MSLAGLNTLPTDRAEQILLGQYPESENLKTYIRNLLLEFDEIHAVSIQAITQRNIDTATGFTLDNIGTLIGIGRGNRVQVAGEFFGYEYAVGSLEFGTSGDANTGGVFRSSGDEVYDRFPWTDAEYRKFIKAQVIKNNSPVTIDAILEILLTVLDGITDAVITNLGGRVFQIQIPEILSDDDKLILKFSNLIPRPVGTRFVVRDSNGPI